MEEKKHQLVRFDWAIKKLLRDKANFDILEGFLGTLLDDENLKIIGILSEESNQDDSDDKFNRVDLMVEDGQKRQIIIEVQTTRESNYLERLLFGVSKVVTEKMNLGQDFSDVKKVISVSILFFNLGSGSDYLYHGNTKFVGMNDGKELILRRKVAAAIGSKKQYQLKDKNIFPEYYLIRVEKYPNIVRKQIDEWIYLIKNNEIKEGSSAKGIAAAKEKLKVMNMSREERKRYENFLINLNRELDMISTAKKEGKEIGRKEGEEIGRKKGEEIGRKKGEEIGRKKGEEIGRKKGEEIGRKKGEEIGNIKSLLKTMKIMPTLAPETIAHLLQTHIETSKAFVSVLETKNIVNIMSFIQAHFFTDIELTVAEQQEIQVLVENLSTLTKIY